MSAWGAAVILVPVVGGIIVTFIVSNFAPEAKGHGVPEVMDAIYYEGGVIRPVVAVVKSLASAFAIGTGAAVGREGPIIQIGSALGSTFGQLLEMSPGQRIILVAAGAGAGIAATFNTPHRRRAVRHRTDAAGSQREHVPAGRDRRPARRPSSAGCSSDRSRRSRCRNMIPLPNESRPGALHPVLYGGLGAMIGVAAAVFMRGLHLVEDRFDKSPGRYTRHIFGMLLVGILMYVLMRVSATTTSKASATRRSRRFWAANCRRRPAD